MKRNALTLVVLGVATTLVTSTLVATSSLRNRRLTPVHNVVLPDTATPGRGDGAITLPNGWHVTPAGHTLPLPGDMPLSMLLSPDNKYLLINTGGFHDHGVQVLDLAAEKLVQTLPVGKDWAGMALDASNGTVYLSGGGGLSPQSLAALRKAATSSNPGRSDILKADPGLQDAFDKPILRLRWQDNTLKPDTGLAIKGLDETKRFIAGILQGKDGALFVANTPTDTVYRLSGAYHTEQTAIPVGYRPYALALSPDGKTVAVSNWGDQSISLLDEATGKEQTRISVGSHPNALCYAPDGRLFVACGGADGVSVIRHEQVLETIHTALTPNAPLGATPVALALSPDSKRLFVANADNNDVAVVDISEAHESKVLGFIPTGWYPSALSVSPDGKKLYIGTGKGLTFRGNFPAQTESPNRSIDGKTHYDYIGKVLSGAVAIVSVPDRKQLDAYTRQVLKNVPEPTDASVSKGQIAEVTRDTLHKIKHVLYIIRENRTYDQVFGDIAEGNGNSEITMYGASITPNAHALAKQTVLLDNLYCNGEVSEDGHQWCNAAYATDFTEKAWINSYSNRGEPDADERLTESPAGYLWDNCARHNLNYYSYGEFADFKSTPDSPPVFAGNPSLNGHASPDWNKFSYDKHDTDKVDDVFIRDLHKAEQTGEWPSFIVMSLGEDHTQGLTPGLYTPFAHVAANDQALGHIVEALSHSRFWKDTAIFVIEDDAQNGADHVDAHRTVGLVLSPYVRHGIVDSTFYTTASMVRTIELILDLPPMTQYDAHATPMVKLFAPQPMMTAYTCLPPQTDLQARNPARGEDAKKSAQMDFSRYDRADPDALNAMLWRAAKPGIPMPAPVRSARFSR